MQQYNNDIENKLRQLENQQLPDLSAMDAHWKEMQTMLSPSIVVPRKNNLLKKYLLAAVSIAAVGLIIYFSLRERASNKAEGLASNTKTGTIIANSFIVPATDTSVKKRSFTMPAWKIVRESNAPPRIIRIDTASFLNSVDSTGPIAEVRNNTALLMNNFYNSIQKPAQEFIISAEIRFSSPHGACYRSRAVNRQW